jgi:mono/diheme cytochrome c family protein
MTLRLLTGIAAMSLGLALAGENLKYTPDPKWQPPADAVLRPNPLAGNTEVVGGGRKLFMRHCAECHSDDGSGRKRAADLQLPVVQNQTDGALFWKITNGNPPHRMPSFSRLPELQRWQLVLFVRTLKSDSPAATGTSNTRPDHASPGQ